MPDERIRDGQLHFGNVAGRRARSDSAGESVLQTKPLLTPGGNLLINARIAARDLAVELVDGSGNVLPGFTRDCCQLSARDPLRYRAVWNGPRGTKTLNDRPRRKPVAIRFILRAGALYGFQVAD